MPPFSTTTINSIPKAAVVVAGFCVIQKPAFVLPAISSIFGIILEPILILFFLKNMVYFRTKLIYIYIYIYIYICIFLKTVVFLKTIKKIKNIERKLLNYFCIL